MLLRESREALGRRVTSRIEELLPARRRRGADSAGTDHQGIESILHTPKIRSNVDAVREHGRICPSEVLMAYGINQVGGWNRQNAPRAWGLDGSMIAACRGACLTR